MEKMTEKINVCCFSLMSTKMSKHLEEISVWVSMNYWLELGCFHMSSISQVRFGVLEARAYGIPQSCRCAFIWASSPEEMLPKRHVFARPELKVNNYAAVHSTATSGPFCAKTFRDVIGDLPIIGNGTSETTLEYPREASSWYQRKFRGDMSILIDHISKKMNELNLIRCRKIPKQAGADWHEIKNGKVRLSSGRIAKLLPSWLTNTGKRHNQWKEYLEGWTGKDIFQPLLQTLKQWVRLECVFTQIRTGFFQFVNVLKLKVIGNIYDSVPST